MAGKQTKRTRRKSSRQKKFQWRPPISLRAVLYVLSLFFLLVFTVGILTYVIFFRMVVAAELDSVDQLPPFEEPLPAQIVAGDGEGGGGGMGPRIAIIVDDMGYHRDLGRQLIELPFALSFSFLPHAPHTEALEKEAYLHGKPVLLHLPLEPKDQNWDPGPGALYLDELARQRRMFLENLAMVPHAVGINNHMGSRYTESRSAMASLLRLIGEQQLFFIDSYTSSQSMGYSLAGTLGVPAARRQVFLDNEQDVAKICAQLMQLTEIARQQGKVIGIAHPHPQTLTALASCLPDVLSDVTLVGVDQLVD